MLASPNPLARFQKPLDKIFLIFEQKMIPKFFFIRIVSPHTRWAISIK